MRVENPAYRHWRDDYNPKAEIHKWKANTETQTRLRPTSARQEAEIRVKLRHAALNRIPRNPRTALLEFVFEDENERE